MPHAIADLTPYLLPLITLADSMLPVMLTLMLALR